MTHHTHIWRARNLQLEHAKSRLEPLIYLRKHKEDNSSLIATHPERINKATIASKNHYNGQMAHHYPWLQTL